MVLVVRSGKSWPICVKLFIVFRGIGGLRVEPPKGYAANSLLAIMYSRTKSDRTMSSYWSNSIILKDSHLLRIDITATLDAFSLSFRKSDWNTSPLKIIRVFLPTLVSMESNSCPFKFWNSSINNTLLSSVKPRMNEAVSYTHLTLPTTPYV